MTRYYHNENPQVEYWMGKCAMLQQELDIANKKLEDVILEINSLASSYKKRCSVAAEYFQEYKKEIKDKEEAFKHFNSLPWYKKMFYKFKV